MIKLIKKFRGGIHPADYKIYTAAKQIETVPVPEKVIIPVRQHIGAPCSPLVKKGDQVKKGQLIATSDAFVSSSIHASISGTVIDVADYPHPIFGKCLSVAIESDGKDEWIEGLPLWRDWQSLSCEQLIDIIRQAGIVGMGGAAFPTHVKLSPAKDKKLDSFIINASECEPFLTTDHRVMLHYAEEIVAGAKIAMKIVGIDKGFIGIEDNKPDAIEAMEKAFSGTNVQVVALPTKYPQGAEKMLIKMLVNREVPSGKLPLDVGVVVNNVSTLVAINDAVTRGIPLIERVVTVSGSAVKEPKNLLLRVGTTFADAVNFCGGLDKPLEKIIMGGPMMGTAQSTLEVPVIKAVSGILCLSKGDVNAGKESTCIRCSRCVEVCPMGLNPSMLGILGERRLYEEAKDDYHLYDCVECGSCVYACPAKRNIVQYIRYCKAVNSAQVAKNKGA